MSKSPGFWFFTGDWLKDTELRLCSIFARGLLVDLLCYMFEAKQQGFLCTPSGRPLTNEQIADLISGGTREEKVNALQELEDNGVLSRDSRGILYSRRLSKLKEMSAKRREAGSKGGSKTQAKLKQNAEQSGKQKRGVTVTVSDSVSDSVSDTDSEEDLNTSCSEPQAASKPKPVDEPLYDLEFKTTGKDRIWKPPQSLVDKLVETYETIDVLFQLRAASMWCETNPRKRKTADGMPRMLDAWLRKEVNNPRAPKKQPPPKPGEFVF